MTMRTQARAWFFCLVLGAVLWLIIAAVLLATVAHAEDERYTSDDVTAAIHQASAEIGVDEAYLTRIVHCEDPSLDPYAVGRLGELGAAQLAPWGELKRFYAWQYTNPFSPWQSVRFLAQRVAMGGASAWSCA